MADPGQSAHNRQDVRRLAIYQVRDVVWQMERGEDIQRVMDAIGEACGMLDIPFLAYAINVVADAEQGVEVIVHIRHPDGSRSETSLPEGQLEVGIILKSWQATEVLYRPDLDRENIYGEHLEDRSHQRVRSVIDVPFSRGTLALVSALPGAYGPERVEILVQMAQVLSEGFRRMDHLQGLAARNRELEETQRLLEREIGEREQAERALRAAHDELELRVAERTADLKTTVEQLTRSNAELEQFAYISAHDLQEPVRNIVGFLQLLQRRYQDALDERGRHLIARSVDGAYRMRTLVGDLLRYSTLDASDGIAETVACGPLLQELRGDFADALAASGGEIEIGDLPTVEADPVQLGQLLRNLLGNALKFRGPAPPRIRVGAERAGAEWRFGVSDNGIGIEPEYCEQIFRIFQRLHPRDEYEGTGIGLALCKKIVERHGGRIWVEAEPGRGSIFYFTLPAQ